MSLTPGTTLGSYAVTAKIGEGGMGEVYRARDTKLDRDVALKVLPPAFTDDPDRLARFEREAKVLASLNHPNIGGIHGLEESDGVRALVLEYIDGPTLADRIAQGPIPVDEALPIAKQIAEALEAAHEQGVIHRDLKPANIKVKDDGTVKVLDFGLAKALDATPEGDPSQSPTLTAAATQMGVIMGTAAYMSPEQARGKVVDKRADIWAFGAVFFEMLTGKKLFDAGDVSEMLASVLVKDPDVSSIGSHVPDHVRSVVRRCLVKDPKERLRDIGDVRLAMAGTFETTVKSSADPVAPQLQVWQRPIPAMAAGLALLLVGGFGISTIMRSEPLAPPLTTRSTITLPVTDQLLTHAGQVLALSPDGSTLVYIATREGVSQLYRRQLDQLDAVPIPDTENATFPFFSPDGEWLAFDTGGVLRKVALAGGPAVTISEVPAGLRSAVWISGDVIVLAAGGSGLQQVPGAGGEPRPLVDLEAGEIEHRMPGALPGGQAVLFTSFGRSAAGEVAVYSLETGERRVLAEGTHPQYVPTGHLVFGRAGTLWAAPFDLDRLEMTREPVPLLEGVVMQDGAGVQAAFARPGALVYLHGGASDEISLVWVNRDGRAELALAGLAGGAQGWARVSSDGTRVAYELTEAGNTDLWVSDLTRAGARSRLTTDPGLDRRPVWTPDGEDVIFESHRNDQVALYRKAGDGTGQEEQVIAIEEAGGLIPYQWSPDGQQLLVSIQMPESGWDIGVLSIEDEPKFQPLLDTAAEEQNPTISPDGEWIAYKSNESGAREIYVARFPSLEDRQPVSTGGGWSPMWSPSGDELFYQSDGAMMVVSLTTEPTLTLGEPEVVFEGSYLGNQSGSRFYDLTPTGDRFLMMQAGDLASSTQMILAQNWFQELTERVPVTR